MTAAIGDQHARGIEIGRRHRPDDMAAAKAAKHGEAGGLAAALENDCPALGEQAAKQLAAGHARTAGVHRDQGFDVSSCQRPQAVALAPRQRRQGRKHALVLLDLPCGDESQALIQAAPGYRRVQQHIPRGQAIEQGRHHAVADALSLQLGRDDHQADGGVVRPKFQDSAVPNTFPSRSATTPCPSDSANCQSSIR